MAERQEQVRPQIVLDPLVRPDDLASMHDVEYWHFLTHSCRSAAWLYVPG